MIPSATSGVIDAVLDRDDDEVDDVRPNRNADAAHVADAPEANDAGVDGETATISRSDDAPPEAIANGSPGMNARADGNVSRDRDSLIVGNPMATGDPTAIGNADDTPDPTGITQLYKLERDIDRKIERYRRDGKDPHDLFDPSKPDYSARRKRWRLIPAGDCCGWPPTAAAIHPAASPQLLALMQPRAKIRPAFRQPMPLQRAATSKRPSLLPPKPPA
jgi:hypothetical protein